MHYRVLTYVGTQSYPCRPLFYIFYSFLTNYKAFSDQL